MPAPIVIQVKLGEKEIPANARAIKTALDAELKDVGNLGADAGQRIGGALSSNVGLSLKKIGQEARQAGTALTAAITLPVLGLGAAIIKTGFDFEKSMNDLTAATKPTNEQLRQATALAKQLGNDLTLPAISANDAAQAMTTLAKSGLSLDQTMRKRCEVRYYWRQRRALTRRRRRRFKATRSIRSSCKRQMPGAWRICWRRRRIRRRVKSRTWPTR